jgi:hypothetical protein
MRSKSELIKDMLEIAKSRGYEIIKTENCIEFYRIC